MKKILVIEDTNYVSKAMQRLLEKNGFHVDIAENGSQGLEKFAAEQFDLVITDILMPKMDGQSFMEEALSLKPSQKIIAISGGSNIVPQEEALRLAHNTAHAVLMKPVENDVLLTTIHKALEQNYSGKPVKHRK